MHVVHVVHVHQLHHVHHGFRKTLLAVGRFLAVDRFEATTSSDLVRLQSPCVLALRSTAKERGPGGGQDPGRAGCEDGPHDGRLHRGCGTDPHGPVRGALASVRPDDMATHVIAAIVGRT